jgi:excisionase family DNA binding protein
LNKESSTVRAREAISVNPLLTPSEVAAAFRVDPKTVTRWAKAGKLSSIRTLGGHRRYLETEIRAMLEEQPPFLDEEIAAAAAAASPAPLGLVHYE